MRLLLSLSALFLAAAVHARPVVVATHTVLADMAAQIAGPEVEVRCPVGVGVDPHSYEPRPADVRLLGTADLVIQIGLGMEPWTKRLLTGSDFKGTLVEVSDQLPHPLTSHVFPAGQEPGPSGKKLTVVRHPSHGSAEEADAHGHDHDEGGEIDPHAWHDVRNAMHYASRIMDALVRSYPEHAEAFRKRGDAYLRELSDLHAYATTRLASIPEAQRKLVTSHDSLGYLGRTYGLTLVPVSGSRPDLEPSAKQVAQLISSLRREKVAAVFFEATSNPKLVRLVAEEAGVKVVDQLYTDSLGPPDSKGATYVGMFRSNVDTLVAALR